MLHRTATRRRLTPRLTCLAGGVWTSIFPALGLAFLTAGTPHFAGAQQVLGPGEDALTVPGGRVRLGVGGGWSIASDAYGPAGTLRPVNVGLLTDSLGTRQLPSLLPLQSTLQSLAGGSTVALSFGRSVVTGNQRVQVMPINLDYGVTRRFQIGVLVPIVKTRSSVSVRTNPNGASGNIALNPAQAGNSVYAADTAFVQQLARSATAVQAYCAGAGAGTSACTSNTGLAAAVQTFSTGLNQVYVNGGIVPTSTSTIHTAIAARATNYRTALNTFAAISGSGVPAVTATGVIGAPAPITPPDFQEIITDKALGFAADSVTTIEHTHLGDIELSAKVLLLDSFGGNELARTRPSGLNARFSVGASYRLPTGANDDPDNFTDIATGTHEAALGVSGFIDVLAGRHFWTSVVARYDHSLGSDVTIRVPDATGTAYLPVYRQATVQRTLGNALRLETTPRWTFNDFVSASLQYAYRHHAANEYSGASFTAGPSIATGNTTINIDPTIAGNGTEYTEHRVGGGFAFSNLRAVAEGRAAHPFEVSYLHSQTVRGHGGFVPQTFSDQFQMRLYTRLFGLLSH